MLHFLKKLSTGSNNQFRISNFMLYEFYFKDQFLLKFHQQTSGFFIGFLLDLRIYLEFHFSNSMVRIHLDPDINFQELLVCALCNVCINVTNRESIITQFPLCLVGFTEQVMACGSFRLKCHASKSCQGAFTNYVYNIWLFWTTNPPPFTFSMV